ncbi:MAG: DUF1508 domain-containing protein [Ruminococcaceae bacterium]|nr:DUF1508 domain-containing protein [Oscillospiraceae bacterium]
MGRFIISRTATGDRFSLVSPNGRRLAVSRNYATLDACKKGIASLIVNAPSAPVVDATSGGYGANPKFEIGGVEGAFVFSFKSPNGKSVITSSAYATKKACLRAISMLRTGVADPELLLSRKGELISLSMKQLDGIGTVTEKKSASSDQPRRKEHDALPDHPAATDADMVLDEIFFDELRERSSLLPRADSPVPEESPARVGDRREDAAPSAITPRLIRLKPRESNGSASPARPTVRASIGAVEIPKKRTGMLGKIFKNK